MRNHRISVKNVILLSIIFSLFGIVVAITTNYKPTPLRVSVIAVQEIIRECQGNFHDLSANEEYVYANCGDGKPITVQNYLFK